MNNYWQGHFCGPIAPYVGDLRTEFSALAYAPSTVTSHLALWAQLSCWLESQGLETSGLTAGRIEEFLAARRKTHRYLYTIKALAPGLTFLRRVGAIPEVVAVADGSEVETLERRFRNYLLVERGLAEVSADTYVVRARPFLTDRARHGRMDLTALTAADVSTFVAWWLPCLAKAPARSTVTAMRALLVFLHATGVIAQPLSSVVPTVASWRLAGLPVGLSGAQIQDLLAACDQSIAVGRRDFAIVTLLARLGLRAREAAALTLDDTSTRRAGTLTVHGKANRHRATPIAGGCRVRLVGLSGTWTTVCRVGSGGVHQGQGAVSSARPHQHQHDGGSRRQPCRSGHGACPRAAAHAGQRRAGRRRLAG